MDDQEKARLARQGLEAAELLEPGAVKDRIKSRVSDAASDAALKGLAAIGRFAGGRERDRSPARARAATAVDVNRALDAMDAQELASFEERLHAAAERQAEAQRQEQDRRMDLDVLRRSFPASSRELALLVFNCVDLMEDVSQDAEGRPPTHAELVRKEQLLTKIAALLAPNAGEALQGFVEHVVRISQHYRRE